VQRADVAAEAPLPAARPAGGAPPDGVGSGPLLRDVVRLPQRHVAQLALVRGPDALRTAIGRLGHLVRAAHRGAAERGAHAAQSGGGGGRENAAGGAGADVRNLARCGDLFVVSLISMTLCGSTPDCRELYPG
jgi:hypothetical protein